MMEEILKEFAKNLPATAAVIFVVCVFINFLKGERELRKETVDSCHESQAKLQALANSALADCNDAIRECAQKHGEVAEALRAAKRG